MIELKSNDYLQRISSLVSKLFKIMDFMLFMNFSKSSLPPPYSTASLTSLTDIKKTWSSGTRPGQHSFSFMITFFFTSSGLVSFLSRTASHLLHRNRAHLDWNSCSKYVNWLSWEGSFFRKYQNNFIFIKSNVL